MIEIYVDVDFYVDYNKDSELGPLPSPFFGLCLYNGESFYPSEGWSDFGCIILSWWAEAFMSLAQLGGRRTLEFMDGPFKFYAWKEGDDVCLSSSDGEFSGRENAVVLLGSLKRALNKAVHYLRLNGIGVGHRDFDVMERWFDGVSEELRRMGG